MDLKDILQGSFHLLGGNDCVKCMCLVHFLQLVSFVDIHHDTHSLGRASSEKVVDGPSGDRLKNTSTCRALGEFLELSSGGK